MKINENQKITLTFGQLKKLVRESYGDDLSDLKSGDILYSSGGYNMIIVSFYEVVSVAGATVTLRKLGNKSVSGDHMSGKCVPDEKSKGRVFRRRFTRFGSLKGEYDSERLRKWDGQPKSYDFWD